MSEAAGSLVPVLIAIGTILLGLCCTILPIAVIIILVVRANKKKNTPPSDPEGPAA